MKSLRASHANLSDFVPKVRIFAGNAFSFSVYLVVIRRADTGLALLAPCFSLLADYAFQCFQVEVSGTGDTGLVLSKIWFFLWTSTGFDGLVENKSFRASNTGL